MTRLEVYLCCKCVFTGILNMYNCLDIAIFYRGHTFDEGVVGKAPISTICSWQYSGGVNMVCVLH